MSGDSAPMIECSAVTVESGPFRLEGLDFRIDVGEYVTLMGQTGCGKTTVLEMICGLRTIVAGQLRVDGYDVTHARPSERGVGYVPQDGALFTKQTVAQHFSFALEVRSWPRDRVRARVAELAEELGVTHLLDRRPAGLSGGEVQRVALGRALSFRPSVLLLDEPLSALDDLTRRQVRELLSTVARQEKVTVLHVTHHRDEAEALGTRVMEFTDMFGRAPQEGVSQ